MRVLVAGPHRMVVESLSAALSRRGFSVLALAVSPWELPARLARYQPDICLLSTSFPSCDGLDVLRVVSRRYPDVKMVMLSSSPDTGLMTGAIEEGAAGFLPRDCHIIDIVRTLPRVRNGERVFDSALLQAVARAARLPAAGHGGRLDPLLTSREQEVLTQIAEGACTRQIARSLAISEATVRTHIQNVLVKLGVHSRLEASTVAPSLVWSAGPSVCRATRGWRRMDEPPMDQPVAISPGRSGKPGDKAILVVDDHVVFAEALAFVLDDVPGLHAFAVTTIEKARRALAEYEVDMVLTEVDLDGDDGMRFVRQAVAENPDLRIVAVTASEDEDMVVDAVLAGFSGWVPKQEPVDQLVSVVHGVLRGETRIPPRLLTRVLAELTDPRGEAARQNQPLAMLTRREREVLDCLTGGMKTCEIARRLCLSNNTLRTHIQNILRKLDVHSTLAAVALARRSEPFHNSLLTTRKRPG